MSDNNPKPKRRDRFIQELARAHPLFWLAAALTACFLLLRSCAP